MQVGHVLTEDGDFIKVQTQIQCTHALTFNTLLHSVTVSTARNHVHSTKNQLHPITLATQDRTLIDHGLQNGGLFTFFVFTNCCKYCNEGIDSKLMRKLLYSESNTKSKN